MDSEKHIEKIEHIRFLNNKNWMDILRLAIKYAPKGEVKWILENIINRDMEVTEAMKRMLEEI